MAERKAAAVYTQDEVKEILHRALEQQQAAADGLSHDELLEVAKEVGIDQAALEQAAADLSAGKGEQGKREAEKAELALARRHEWFGFASSLVSFLVFGPMLYFVDQRFTGGVWARWVLLAWGIGIVFHLLGLFAPGHDERLLAQHQRVTAKAQRKQEKRERHAAWHHQRERDRAARHERRHRRREARSGAAEARGHAADIIEEGAKEFERAVQEGVAAMLTVAARKIQTHAQRAVQDATGTRDDTRGANATRAAGGVKVRVEGFSPSGSDERESHGPAATQPDQPPNKRKA